ncbi:type II toxin-antitoxin system RelE family toxin [Candidatus Marithrix sp. Canyon 246]|uniref:type II toxin-antitoxin system RelE family toxin n=1 Tax=Candidatus Marithrix sp. Canyon 246 TaxID=1827136 RepID=UPI00084A2582|nr:type II toxin-antitoxin system RelE/ParE family toxin [Candidatus Marithrix sp. Canyon 246]
MVISWLIFLNTVQRLYVNLKLQGFENRYRIRVGDYRVIYEIYDDVLQVLIVKVGPRRDIY